MSREEDSTSPTPVLTIGHSTRTIDRFIALLRPHQINMLADVRTIPRSRRNPQFNSEAFALSLLQQGIAYRHMPGLGGLRHPASDSINTGWRNASFRGYADYMQTRDFEQNLDSLIDVAQLGPTVVMCAEALPWRCHRSLIADALLVRGLSIGHIINGAVVQPHKLTSFARVQGTRIIYPPEP